MGCQPIVRNIGAVHKTTLYHVPTQEPLESAHKEQNQTFFDGRLVQFFGEQEVEEGQNEHNADKSTDDPVQPFPKIDILKFLNTKMIVKLLVLRILLVQLKGFLPFLLVHGRDGTLDELIIGDGETRVGEARDAAHQNHDKDEKTSCQQPIHNSFVRFHSEWTLRFIFLPFSNIKS